jgi:hypothetical protein
MVSHYYRAGNARVEVPLHDNSVSSGGILEAKGNLGSTNNEEVKQAGRQSKVCRFLRAKIPDMAVSKTGSMSEKYQVSLICARMAAYPRRVTTATIDSERRMLPILSLFSVQNICIVFERRSCTTTVVISPVHAYRPFE